jgi:hypothetical protein
MHPRARAASWRWNGATVLRLAVLFAFCIQTFLVQTHVHLTPLAPHSFSGTAAVSVPHDGKAPLDADRCLFCQEYTHAGTYLTPAVAAALPPTITVVVVALVTAPVVAAKAVSHIWMGRAPPRS